MVVTVHVHACINVSFASPCCFAAGHSVLVQSSVSLLGTFQSLGLFLIKAQHKTHPKVTQEVCSAYLRE